MNEQMRVQRPAAPQGGMMREAMPYSNESSKLPWVIAIVVILIAVLAGAYFMLGSNGAGAAMGGNKYSINKDKFQAVFLSNNQVYFGKITSVNSDEIVLENIHYLQLNNVQGAGAQTGDNGSTQIVLVKLGNELHGPEDRMHISKNQVIFYEDLKDDGRVVQSIKNSNSSGGASQNVTPPAGGAPAAPAAR